jgi:hypothetical protein
MDLSQDLCAAIDVAFDFRGHVTCALHDGSQIEGFLFNRDFAPMGGGDPFVALYLKGSGEAHRIPMAQLASVSCSGTDHAAGKSYQEWLEKTGRQ